jgi:periplasmic divalent cation tolerance protein
MSTWPPAVSDAQPIIILVTAGSAENAETIARALVSERLAACVNVFSGLRSIYRWQGDITADSECMLLIKTVRGRFDAVESRVKSLHDYELPEVVALDVVEGSKPYLDWLLGAVSASE